MPAGNLQESRTRGCGMGIRRVRVRGSRKCPAGHPCPSLLASNPTVPLQISWVDCNRCRRKMSLYLVISPLGLCMDKGLKASSVHKGAERLSIHWKKIWCDILFQSHSPSWRKIRPGLLNMVLCYNALKFGGYILYYLVILNPKLRLGQWCTAVIST